jgi:reactive intermediate/imine deaminase
MSKKPYSRYRIAGNFIFVSGQTGFNPINKRIGDTIEEQTDQTLRNIELVLKEAGASLKDVIKCSVFLSDISEFKRMNGIYMQFFEDPPPARTTVKASLSNPKMKIEIDAIAHVQKNY